MAARPKTLGAAVAPVVMATAIAWQDGAFHWPSALCALAGAMLIQIGTNFANDYFDFVKGTDTEERVGPTRATQAGLVAPETMRLAMIITFGLVALPGAYILYRGGWPFLVIGVASIACGVLYTAGPLPLGYIGLADLFVLVFFGPVAVCGTYYLQAHALTTPVVVASLAPGLLSVALLTVNNLRDIEQDRKAGKRTLAVRLGRTFAQYEYAAAIGVACVVVPLYLYLTTERRFLPLVSIVVLGMGAGGIRTVFTETEGPPLNRALGLTGRLLLVFSLLFSLGWIL
jgi:1,4-dihydroxy-2-naphthoate polyprenyltransferase